MHKWRTATVLVDSYCMRCISVSVFLGVCPPLCFFKFFFLFFGGGCTNEHNDPCKTRSFAPMGESEPTAASEKTKGIDNLDNATNLANRTSLSVRAGIYYM